MYAVSVIKMIDRLDRADFREMIARLALVLRAEGLAAHRSADRLEGLSEYTDPVAPAEHARESILAKISDCYTEQPWHVAAAYLARLWAVSAAALDDRVQLRQQLRQQAAILLDAAETIDRLLQWYDARITILAAQDLTLDTIVAIMREWKTEPRETARQLKVHGHAVTEGALKMARGRGRGRTQAGVPPLPFYIPALHRRR